MARLLGVFCLLVVGMLLVAGTAATQEKKATGKGKNPLPKGFKDVGLSPEQDAKARAIMANYAGKIKKINDQVKELKQQETSDLTKLLTPEQKEKLTKILLGDEPKKEKEKDKDK